MQIGCTLLNGRTGHDAGRELLAQMYRKATGEELPAICTAPQGKPYFPDSPRHFSISHTKRRAVCVLSDKPVGVDAEETHRQIDLRLAGKILSPPERQRYAAAADKRLTLLRFWVLKEAYAKLTGRGWGSYLYQTDFDPADPRIQKIDGCLVAVLEEQENIYVV